MGRSIEKRSDQVFIIMDHFSFRANTSRARSFIQSLFTGRFMSIEKFDGNRQINRTGILIAIFILLAISLVTASPTSEVNGKTDSTACAGFTPAASTSEPQPTLQPTIQEVWDMHPKIISYDKSRWTKFDTRTMGFAGNPMIRGIFARSNNLIWVETSDGLAYFNGSTWTIFPVKDGFDTWYMVLDKKGVLWTKIKKDSVDRLARYTGKEWVFFDTPLDTPAGSPGMIEDSNGLYWFIDNQNPEQNVASFDGKTWKYYPIFTKSGDLETVRGFHVDSKGHMWAGSQHALYYHNGTSWKSITNPILSGSEFETGVDDFVVSQDETVWLIVNRGSLLNFKDGVFTQYVNLYLNTIDNFLGVSLLLDNSGSLWIGAKSDGIGSNTPVLRLSKSEWDVFEHPHIGYVTDLSQAGDGALWVASVEAIYRYQP